MVWATGFGGGHQGLGPGTWCGIAAAQQPFLGDGCKAGSTARSDPSEPAQLIMSDNLQAQIAGMRGLLG